MATEPLLSGGFSKKWTGLKLNVRNTFDQFREHNPENKQLYPVSLEELPESVVYSGCMRRAPRQWPCGGLIRPRGPRGRHCCCNLYRHFPSLGRFRWTPR